MPEFELHNRMSALSELSPVLSVLEGFHASAARSTASSSIFCNVLYNAKEGNIQHILDGSNYTPSICARAYDFVATRWEDVRLFGNSRVIEQWEELNLRLKHILNAKRNTEDPLGW